MKAVFDIYNIKLSAASVFFVLHVRIMIYIILITTQHTVRYEAIVCLPEVRVVPP